MGARSLTGGVAYPYFWVFIWLGTSRAWRGAVKLTFFRRNSVGFTIFENYKRTARFKNANNCGKHISNVVALYLKCLRAFFDYL